MLWVRTEAVRIARSPVSGGSCRRIHRPVPPLLSECHAPAPSLAHRLSRCRSGRRRPRRRWSSLPPLSLLLKPPVTTGASATPQLEAWPPRLVGEDEQCASTMSRVPLTRAINRCGVSPAGQEEGLSFLILALFIKEMPCFLYRAQSTCKQMDMHV
jgi:hypothetical protein